MHTDYTFIFLHRKRQKDVLISRFPRKPSSIPLLTELPHFGVYVPCNYLWNIHIPCLLMNPFRITKSWLPSPRDFSFSLSLAFTPLPLPPPLNLNLASAIRELLNDFYVPEIVPPLPPGFHIHTLSPPVSLHPPERPAVQVARGWRGWSRSRPQLRIQC